ncbi:MAG: hypothetical protein ACRDZY_22545, partial [Acidimicrobiales bacterium]
IVRMALPPAIAIGSLLPLFAGRHPAVGVSPAVAVAGLVPPVFIVAILVGAWLRNGDRLRAWMRTVMDESATARRPSTPAR